MHLAVAQHTTSTVHLKVAGHTTGTLGKGGMGGGALTDASRAVEYGKDLPPRASAHRRATGAAAHKVARALFASARICRAHNMLHGNNNTLQEQFIRTTIH